MDFTKFMEEKLMPIAGKMGEQRHLNSIKNGLMAVIPLLIVGSVALIIAQPPIQSLQELVAPFADKLMMINAVTFDMISLIAAFSIAFSLGKEYEETDPMFSGVISVVVFLLLIPFAENGNIIASWLASEGLFIAIVGSIFTVELLKFTIKKDWTISLPESVPPTVSKSFSSLIPAFVVIVTAWLINLGFIAITSSPFPVWFNELITAPLLAVGGSYWGMMVIIIVVALFWFVGVHGNALALGPMMPIWLSLLEQNTNAMQEGAEVLPNIINTPFYMNFVTMGGSGTTLVLALILAFFAKSTQFNAIGKTSLGPGLFNINEPIIFGTPIVMNPIMIIPFTLAPLSAATISYFAMAMEWVARPSIYVPWTTPPVISGYLTTGDWKASVLQVVTMLIAGLIYYPFVKVLDNKNVKEEQESEAA